VKFHHFSVESFETLRGVKGAFAPRLSVVCIESESGKASFMRFIRQILSFGNLFGGESRAAGKQPSKEEQVSKKEQALGKQVLKEPALGCLVFRMDDGRALRAEPGGLRSLARDAEDSAGSVAEDSVAEEIKYLCLAASAGLETIAFSDFAARMDEAEKEAEKALGAPAEGEQTVSDRIRDNEAEIETLREIKRNSKAFLEELEEKRNSAAWTAGQLKDERRRLRRLEFVSRARPLWLEARDLEKTLAALGPRRARPRDGTARLDALLEKAAALQKEVDAWKLKSDCEALRRKHMENNPSLSLLPYREALENLEEETNQLKQTRIEMLPLIEEVHDSEKRLAGALADFSPPSEISPGWTEKDLREANLSLSFEDRANTVREALRAAERRAGEISLELEAEQTAFAALESEIASVRAAAEKIELQRLETKRQKAETPGPANFEERRDRLLEIRHGLLRNDILFWEIRAEKMRADTLEEEIRAEGDPPEPSGSYIAKFLLALFLCFSGTAAALEYLTAILHPYGLAAALFFASIALFPLASIVLERKKHNRRTQWWKERYTRRCETIKAIEARIEEKRRKMQAIAASVEQKSKDLGIRMPSTADDLDGEFDRLADEILRSRRLEDRQDEERQVLQKMDQSVRRKNQLSEELKRVRQEAEKIRGDWRAWLEQNRFDANLTPEGFLSFLERMREARRELELLESLRARLERRQEYASTLETKLRVLSGRVGMELSGESLPAIFRSLEESLELKKQIEASLEAQNAVDLERSVWEKELAAVSDDIRSLCEEARVSDAAAFRALVGECGRREAAEARLDELRRLLTGLLGAAGEDGGDLRGKALKPRRWAAYEAEFLGDALKQAEEMEELRMSVADRESALEKLKAACDILERRICSPFAEERLAELERENEALRAGSRMRLQTRLTIVLTKQFAEKAAERNAKERRKIVRRAKQLFSKHFSSPEGETGVPRDEAWLCGQEQAALCLKLAAAYRRAERAESIPLVLDDVFAYFDENRRHEIVQALWRTSERVQIVLLTDQPFTARLIQNDLERQDGFALLRM
jgi:uncharacterized protein YhaN